MEKLLLKLARQLDSLDEASLMALWSKYATMTSRFEPTKRWEDACLVFSLIQAKRWKNQLFNYTWGQQRMPPLKNSEVMQTLPMETGFELEKPEQEAETGHCRVLAFQPASGQPAEASEEE